MKKIITKNFYIFISYFVLWILIDFIDVKLQKLPGFKYELQFALALVYASFLWVNRSLFYKFNVTLRCFFVATISFAFTALWFLVSVFSTLQFHLAIGGHL